MPLNFPNSPSLNDFFVAGGRRWQWNGTAWQRIPDPGAQGVQGNQGNTGPTGAQGHQGATAAAGAQGAQGSAGSNGTNGAQGAQGAQGVNGNFGGASFEYTYLTNTTDSDPGAGSLKFNNANLTSATILYIDDTDGGSSNTDIQPFLRTIDDSTSTIKGHVKVSTKTNPDEFVLYTIASLTEATGYFKVTVAYVSGSVTSFTNSSDVSITFARTGDAGSTGAQGNQGYQGAAGAQGAQGQAGASAGLDISTGAPSSPSTGDLWWDSDDGDLHVYYNDGDSSQWVAINVGPMGAQGTQGHQGHQGQAGSGAQGAQGTAGAQGAQGHQGSGGSTGAQGDDANLAMSTGAPSSPDAGDLWFDTDSGILSAYYNDGNSSQWVEVSTGPKGDTGAQGAQGHQGAAGAQGAQGHQGATAAAGAQGAQGNQGHQGAGGSAGAQGNQGHQGAAGSATISSNADNRVITGGSGSNLVGESNLTFDGSTLAATGGITATGTIETTGSHLKITGAEPRLTFTDSDNNPDFQIWANAQKFSIYDSTNSATRINIDSSGHVCINTTTEGNPNADDFTISYNNQGVSGGDQGRCGMTIRSGENTSNVMQPGYIYFSDGTSGDNESKGVVAYDHNLDDMYFSTDGVEKLRIDDNGTITQTATTAFQIAKGTTAERPSGVDGMLRFNTSLTQTEEYRDGDWYGLSNKSAVSGGSQTTSGSYTIHTFTSSGTLIVSGSAKSGVDYLLVGGGGGGGSSRAGGGGGGGMTVTTGATLQPGTYTITVGGGGAGSTNSSGTQGTSGSNTSLGSIASVNGGGGGGGGGGASDRPGLSGGSGGGGSDGYSGGAGTSGQGNNGGGSTGSSGGGGGGGKGGVGSNGDTNGEDSGGNGGNGGSNSYSGSNQTYGAGGGGGSRDNGTYGSGVHGGGNGGQNNSNVATAGSANQGGGGGGGARLHGSNTSTFYGANGGSGIVIIRYLT